jgi:hypothetical protein
MESFMTLIYGYHSLSPLYSELQKRSLSYECDIPKQTRRISVSFKNSHHILLRKSIRVSRAYVVIMDVKRTPSTYVQVWIGLVSVCWAITNTPSAEYCVERGWRRPMRMFMGCRNGNLEPWLLMVSII